jgi:hypothetical protein
MNALARFRVGVPIWDDTTNYAFSSGRIQATLRSDIENTMDIYPHVDRDRQSRQLDSPSWDL